MSWSAVVAGALTAGAVSLVVFILGAGLGVASISPWTQEVFNATDIGVAAILWLVLTQILASAAGGYLAGRLRHQMSDAEPAESRFRDAAHGFLAWSAASLFTAALLLSVSTGVLVQVPGSASAAAADGAGFDASSGSMDYAVDSLFRRDPGPAASAADSATAQDSMGTSTGKYALEVSRIFMSVNRFQGLPTEDIRYLGQIVAPRTGLSQQDAEKRVAEVHGRLQARLRDVEASARASAEKSLKVSARSALWFSASLLIGAFVAVLSASRGGQRRRVGLN